MASTNQLNFRGFSNPTTTPVPDEIFDSLMYHLSGAELKVLLYICRRTFGFKKSSDDISLNQMLNGIVKKNGERLDLGVGIKSKVTLLKSLKNLCDNGVIIAEQRRSAAKGNEPTNYRLRMINDPLAQKLYQGGYKNYTEGRVNSYTKPLAQKVDQEQQTVLQETENNNDDVVQALINFGISTPIAQKYGKEYPEDYLASKLAWAEWLLNKGEIGGDGRNAAGWLNTAIIGDYKPATDYVSPSQLTIAAKQAEEEAAERRRQEQEFQKAKEMAIKRVRENNPPEPIGEDGLTTESAWTLTLKRLQEQIQAGATYETWLKDTILLGITGNTAQVMVPNAFAAEWLRRRLYQSIARTLSDVIHQDIEVEFVAADVILAA